MAHHHQKSAPRTVVLGGLLKVVHEAVDALGQNRDLGGRVTRVFGGGTEFGYEVVFLFFCNHREDSSK